jgi:hypothetical protein
MHSVINTWQNIKVFTSMILANYLMITVWLLRILATPRLKPIFRTNCGKWIKINFLAGLLEALGYFSILIS